MITGRLFLIVAISISIFTVLKSQADAKDGPSGEMKKVLVTPVELMKSVVATCREKGIPAGIAELEKRLNGVSHYSAANSYALNPYFHKLYKEGQIYSGKADPEWGVALYRWAYHNSKHYQTNYDNLVFLTNYTWLMRRCGYRGTMRKLMDEWQEILAGKGFNTDPRLALPGEPAVAFLPETRLIRYQDSDRLDMSHTRFARNLAEQNLSEGKWKEALSHYVSLEKPCDVMWQRTKGYEGVEVEWMNEVAEARMGAASVFELLEFHELADEFRNKNIDDRAGVAYRHRPRSVAFVWKEYRRLIKHEVDDKTLERIDYLLERIPNNIYHLPRSLVMAKQLRVMALFELGKTEEAWASLNLLLEKKPVHDRLKSYWIEVMIDHGRLEGVESALLEMLDSVRQKGEKTKEIELYFQYARFLGLSERWSEAALVTQQGIQLLKTFDIYTRLPKAHLELADIYEKLGNPSRAIFNTKKGATLLASGRKFPEHVRSEVGQRLKAASEALKSDGGNSLVDLQPRESVSVPLFGFPAQGLIILSNRGDDTVLGSVEVTGFHRKVEGPDRNGVFHLVVDSEQKIASTLKVRVAIEAGQSYFFDFETERENERLGESRILWRPERGMSSTALWNFHPGGSEAESRAIIDAGVYSENPFHAVPIYHCVQSKAGLKGAMDLRVIASQEARIELYDESEQLVFVDHNGNGQFDDAGDILALDGDRNGFPDITIDEDEDRSSRFVMLIYPGKVQKEGLELALSYRDETGEWVEVSRDRIMSNLKSQKLKEN